MDFPLRVHDRLKVVDYSILAYLHTEEMLGIAAVPDAVSGLSGAKSAAGAAIGPIHARGFANRGMRLAAADIGLVPVFAIGIRPAVAPDDLLIAADIAAGPVFLGDGELA